MRGVDQVCAAHLAIPRGIHLCDDQVTQIIRMKKAIFMGNREDICPGGWTATGRRFKGRPKTFTIVEFDAEIPPTLSTSIDMPITENRRIEDSSDTDLGIAPPNGFC